MSPWQILTAAWKGWDLYELRGRVIVRRARLFREQAIPLDAVESWSSFPEMTFDVVEIRLRDGRCLTWFDHRDDLTAISRASMPPTLAL